MSFLPNAILLPSKSPHENESMGARESRKFSCAQTGTVFVQGQDKLAGGSGFLEDYNIPLIRPSMSGSKEQHEPPLTCPTFDDNYVAPLHLHDLKPCLCQRWLWHIPRMSLGWHDNYSNMMNAWCCLIFRLSHWPEYPGYSNQIKQITPWLHTFLDPFPTYWIIIKIMLLMEISGWWTMILVLPNE